jgi:hypothetical protein
MTKSQVPNPKPLRDLGTFALGFGLWDLGFGISR